MCFAKNGGYRDVFGWDLLICLAVSITWCVLYELCLGETCSLACQSAWFGVCCMSCVWVRPVHLPVSQPGLVCFV